jgi:hypothetical protein
MRSLSQVWDLDRASLMTRSYDVAIFASGYESRARAFARMYPRQRPSRVLVYGFSECQDHPSRLKNDDFFEREFGVKPVLAHENGPRVISRDIETLAANVNDRMRILVDISSMSRSWYADLINWARFSAGPKVIELDFVYFAGEYPHAYPSRIVSKTTSLFGFEGRSDTQLETVALIGLGYDCITPHAILEDLQPEVKLAFIAGAGDEAALLRALSVNAHTIEELDAPIVILPLLSVEAAYRNLLEMAAPHIGVRNIVFITLGPKTHVLAALLVSVRSPEIACLHVRGRSEKPVDVLPGKGMVVCSALFE